MYSLGQSGREENDQDDSEEQDVREVINFAACRVHIGPRVSSDSVLKNTPHIYVCELVCVVKYAHPTCYVRLHALT